jgi:hypothetical protein
MRGAVEERCHLRAGILMVAGTAIATVTLGPVSASDPFFSITRQGVPLKAKDKKLRAAEDEGCLRGF